MSRNRLSPPQLYYDACLVRLRSSTQKGGTIIAERVTDYATHEWCLCDPSRYWPPFCPRCRGRRWHVHDYRERMLRAEPGLPAINTVRLACVACQAIWQILPLFVARHLWRSWDVIRRVLMRDPERSSSREGRGWPKVRRCRGERCGDGDNGGYGRLSHWLRFWPSPVPPGLRSRSGSWNCGLIPVIPAVRGELRGSLRQNVRCRRCVRAAVRDGERRHRGSSVWEEDESTRARPASACFKPYS